MKRIILVDVDNCIANVNSELQKKGYRTDVYPSPIPPNVFECGSIFRDAKPITNVINHIENIKVKGRDLIVFITARPNKSHIRKITREWIIKHTPFEPFTLYTNGVYKGKVIKKLYTTSIMRDYDWVVIDDAPHEIMSYVSLKKEANINMDIYIPEWSYNCHINVGAKIERNAKREQY